MKSSNALVIGIAGCFVAVVTACTAIYIANPAGENITSVLTILLGSLGSTIAVLATLAKVGDVDKRVGDVDRKVDFLANGGTDAKIRAGIADVVKDEFLKDEEGTAEQLEADRAHRAAGPPTA